MILLDHQKVPLQALWQCLWKNHFHITSILNSTPIEPKWSKQFNYRFGTNQKKISLFLDWSSGTCCNKAVKWLYIFVRGIPSFRIASQNIIVYAIAVISVNCRMALGLSTILTSGNSSLIQAKQVWGSSAPQGKSFVIGSFSTCFWIKRNLLHLIKYLICYWNICRDRKVIRLLLGLQELYQASMLFVSFGQPKWQTALYVIGLALT